MLLTKFHLLSDYKKNDLSIIVDIRVVSVIGEWNPAGRCEAVGIGCYAVIVCPSALSPALSKLFGRINYHVSLFLGAFCIESSK